MSHFSARLMTVTGKFGLPIGRPRQLTNRQSEFSSHSTESRTKNVQCKRALMNIFSQQFIEFTFKLVIKTSTNEQFTANIFDEECL